MFVYFWGRAGEGGEKGGLNEVVVAKILLRLLDSSQVVFIRDSGDPATA